MALDLTLSGYISDKLGNRQEIVDRACRNYVNTLETSIQRTLNNLPIPTDGHINELINAKTDGHSHANKSVLDTITAERMALWDSNQDGTDSSTIMIITAQQSPELSNTFGVSVYVPNYTYNEALEYFNSGKSIVFIDPEYSIELSYFEPERGNILPYTGESRFLILDMGVLETLAFSRLYYSSDIGQIINQAYLLVNAQSLGLGLNSVVINTSENILDLNSVLTLEKLPRYEGGVS